MDFLRENLESNLYKKIYNYIENNKLKLINENSDINLKISNIKYIVGVNIDRNLNLSK